MRMNSTPRSTRSSATGWTLIALCVATGMAARATGSDALAAARSSVLAGDAGRHVAALADDTFEGREAGSRGGRAAGAYIVEELREAGLEAAGDEGTYFQRFGAMRNILALIPGSDPAHARELVVVGAHYDHVGYGNPANSYGPTGLIHNGADDNASGVAGLLEIAEAIAGLPTRPRRPVLIAFWDGEEKGLLGSRHYLRARPAAIADRDPVFSLNLDMIGRLRGERVEVYGARSALGLRRLLAESNRARGLELVFDWDVVDDSDHFPFLASGIPTLMLHTGLHDQYHRPSDDAHLVDPVGIEAVARLALDVVLAVADDAGEPPAFRAACREEKNANRDALERTLPPAPATARGRWGMSTRGDTGDPTAPVVVRVVPGTPLANAGLLEGDRIVAIDDTPVVDQDDMLRRLAAADDRATLRVERKGRTVMLHVEGAGPPATPATR